MGNARIYIGGANIIQTEPNARVRIGGVNIIFTETALWEVFIQNTSQILATLVVESAMPPVVGRWTWPVSEHLIFNTAIGQSHNRTEQRIALRQGIAAQEISTRILIEGDCEFARFEAAVHSWLKERWSTPLWPQAVLHEGLLPAGTSSIPIETRYSDFRESGIAMIWKDRENHEYVSIDSIADDALTLSSATGGDYEGCKFVIPCLFGRILSATQIERHQGGALIDISFRIEDVAAVTGFAARMSYDGYTVLTDPAIWLGGSGDAGHDPDIAVLDAGTGPFAVISNSTCNEVTQSHGWCCRTPAECWWFRQLLYALKGMQKAVLVPTFRDDITLTRPLDAAGTILYVRNAGHTEMGLNSLRTYLAFRPAGGDIIPRKVTDITAVSTAEERIDINTAAGSAFGPGDSLCWVDKCRLASDQVEIEWYECGKMTADTPMVRVTE